MNMRNLLYLALLAFVMAGCSRNQGVEPLIPQPADTTATEPAPDRSTDWEDAARLEREERERAERARAMRVAAIETTVHFGFDEYSLDRRARADLDVVVDALKGDESITIRLEGHTDARGSAEYNLALGQRRATAVHQYLHDRGVSEDRLATVSYGEEAPVIRDASSEDDHAQNRRVEIVITN